MNAIVIGGASGVWQDISQALPLGQYDISVACNDAIAHWPGRLDAAVSLHPDKLPGWIAAREANGHKPPGAVYVKAGWRTALDAATVERVEALSPIETDQMFAGQAVTGSSGLFAAKVALEDLGCAKAVCCGVPMNAVQGHFFDDREWAGASLHQAGWNEAKDAICDRLRSMSGWTREIVGAPTPEWLLG